MKECYYIYVNETIHSDKYQETRSQVYRPLALRRPDDLSGDLDMPGRPKDIGQVER